MRKGLVSTRTSLRPLCSLFLVVASTSLAVVVCLHYFTTASAKEGERKTSARSKISTRTLRGGALMPVVGLGTWRSPPDDVESAVYVALREGYRHIDCAAVYGNEKAVGKGIRRALLEGVVTRHEIFVTSKLANYRHERTDVVEALRETLSDLQLEYLNLYLIHWPVNTRSKDEPRVPLDREARQPSLSDTWRGMADARELGLTIDIGVSNFGIERLTEIISQVGIVPAVNQVERHPLLRQEDLLKYCDERGIIVTAYSPLGNPGLFGDGDSPLRHPTTKALSLKYKRSSAQILIRWAIQCGTVVIPKSTNPTRIVENLSIFDFVIEEADMMALSALGPQRRFVQGAFYVSERGWYRTMDELFK